MSCGSTTGLLCRELGARGSARQTSKMDKVEIGRPLFSQTGRLLNPNLGRQTGTHTHALAKKRSVERCNGVGLPHAGTVARDRGHPRSGCGLWTGDRSVYCRLTPRVRAGTQSLCEALHRWICHRPNPPPPSTKPISAFAISAAAIAISTASIAISAARTSKKAKAVITLAAASPRGYVCRRARDALLHGQSLAAQSMAAQRYRAGNEQHSQWLQGEDKSRP